MTLPDRNRSGGRGAETGQYVEVELDFSAVVNTVHATTPFLFSNTKHKGSYSEKLVKNQLRL